MASNVPHDFTEANIAVGAEPALTIPLSVVGNIDDSTLERDLYEHAKNYDSIDWKRLPDYQIPFEELVRNPSFIWKHGYRIQKRSSDKKVYFLCAYCHQHLRKGGLFETEKATSSAKTHLAINQE